MLNHEKMKKYEDMLCRELDKIEMEIDKSGGMTSGVLDAMHKITDTIKNLKKIEMLGEGGSSHNSYGRYYSRDGEWTANGSYNNGDSYGSYGGSYGDDNGYSGRMHYVRGHYSRDEAKDSMISRLEALMTNASSDRDKQTIRETISTLRSM